jgi:predicted RNase H-like HicB family nuclease
VKNRYTAVVKKDAGWWIGWVEEMPGVNCQEKTRAGLLRSLRVTLKEAIELNRKEARAFANGEMEVELLLV